MLKSLRKLKDIGILCDLKNYFDVWCIIRGRPERTSAKMTPFYTPPLCPHFTNHPPLCGRPHLASYTALWSDSVIAGAVKIRCSLISSGHFTPTPCGLIAYVSHVINNLRSSPYYSLWCKLYKMNNNLYFNRHHPQSKLQISY